MAARRCSMCGISYPDEYPFLKCHVCEEKTDHISNDKEDPNWQALVTWKRRVAWEATQVAGAIPGPSDDSPLSIFEQDGLFWVPDGDLRRADICPPSDRRMFLFRAHGHIWEAQGYDNKRRRWWVEEVALEEVIESPPPVKQLYLPFG